MGDNGEIRRWIFRIGIIALVAMIAVIVVVLAVVLSSPREWTTNFTRHQLESADFQRHVYEHDRGHVTYFQSGDGPPLIFVHGIADQAGSWYRLAGDYTGDFTVTVPDLPAHGESPFRGDGILDDRAHEVIAELFDEWTADEPAWIVANSLGGWVVLEYALEHPKRVRGVIAASPAGLEHDIDPALLMPSTREEARTTIRSIFGERAPWVPGFVLDRVVERSDESVIADVWDHLDDVEYLDDRIGELDVPVVLVWGTEDRIFPVDYARRFDESLPRSQLRLLDGCGHAPQIACPGEFAEVLDEHLTDGVPSTAIR